MPVAPHFCDIHHLLLSPGANKKSAKCIMECKVRQIFSVKTTKMTCKFQENMKLGKYKICSDVMSFLWTSGQVFIKSA
jgi:hypothetical protein